MGEEGPGRRMWGRVCVCEMWKEVVCTWTQHTGGSLFKTKATVRRSGWPIGAEENHYSTLFASVNFRFWGSFLTYPTAPLPAFVLERVHVYVWVKERPGFHFHRADCSEWGLSLALSLSQAKSSVMPPDRTELQMCVGFDQWSEHMKELSKLLFEVLFSTSIIVRLC